jgi:WD40 repeat protein
MAHVVCQVVASDEQVSLTWSEGPASFEPYQLKGQVFRLFRKTALQARQRLADLVKDYLNGPEEELRRTCFALAQAGYKLYGQLFAPDQQQLGRAQEVFQWLTALRDQDALEDLELVIEGPQLVPWNVIYDREPSEPAFREGGDRPDRWLPFWGVRYNLAGGRRVNPLRRLPVLDRSRVLLVVDPGIHAGLPPDQRQRLDDFAAGHRLTQVASREELARALQERRPDLLYWLGHARPDALVLDGEEIGPTDLLEMLRGDNPGVGRVGGLAFLNACQTAEDSPLGSFLDTLYDFGLSGAIATEQQTIDTFAAPFGLDFLEAFLDRGEPAGAALRRLRARVPLGLLYATYCPPYLRMRAAAEAAQPAAPAVQVVDRVAGTPLGAAPPAPRPAGPLPPKPYLSLAYYDREQRALFAGRDADVQRFALLLDDPATRVLVLHGESGVGKSSFLRAGVLPYLEEECVGYRALREGPAAGDRDRSVLLLRATNDPVGQVAQALARYCAAPYVSRTPAGTPSAVDLPGLLRAALGLPEAADRPPPDPEALRAALGNDPSLLARILRALGDHLPFGLVLIVDQCEEVFTLARTPPDVANRDRALEMLHRTAAGTGDFKVILALRTEYYGRLINRLRRNLPDLASVREYLLTDFEEPELVLDQCEEIFTRGQSTGDEPLRRAILEKLRRDTLEMLRRVVEAPGDFKLILSLRTEYYGRLLDGLRRGLRGPGVIRDYLLTDLDEERLIQVIVRPTSEDPIPHSREIPRARYRFVYAPGVAEQVARESLVLSRGRHDSVLPLVQIVCTQLYNLVRARLAQPGVEETIAVRAEDWELIGGAEGGLRRHVDGLVAGLLPNSADADAFKNLFAQLYLPQPDGTLSSALLSAETLRRRWAGPTPFDDVLALAVREDVRLLRVLVQRAADGSVQDHVCLGHDALAKVAADWEQETAGREGLRKNARRALYAAHMDLALRAWQDLHYDRVRELLERQRPEPGQEGGPDDLRTFEWYYVWRLSHGDWATLRSRTEAGVCAVAVSPDGRLLAAAGDEAVLRLWEVDTGRERQPIRLPGAPGHCVAFSPDGRLVACGTPAGELGLYDALTGEPRRTFPGHEGGVTAVAFSPADALLATGGGNGIVRLWDWSTEQPARVAGSHRSAVAALAFAPDGRTLAAAGADGAVWLRGTTAAAPPRALQDPPAPVRSVAFSPDGRDLATADEDGAIRIWDAATGREVRAVGRHAPPAGGATAPGAADAVAFAPDGKSLASGGEDWLVRLWDPNAGSEEGVLRGHTYAVTSLAWFADGRRLASGGADGTVKIWEAAEGRRRDVLPGHTDFVGALAFSPDGAVLASGGDDRTVRLWDAATGASRATLTGHAAAVYAVAFSPDGRTLASAGLDKAARLWDPGAPEAAPRSSPDLGPVYSLAFSRSGLLALAGRDTTVWLWDPGGSGAPRGLSGHADEVFAVAFSPDGKALASAGADKAVRLWDPVTGQERVAFAGHEKPVRALAFSPDGATLASAGDDWTVRLWDTRRGREEAVLRGHSREVRALAFADDGKTLASGGYDGTVRFWDPAAAQERGTLWGGLGQVFALAFAPGARLLASSGEANTVRLWRAASPDDGRARGG